MTHIEPKQLLEWLAQLPPDSKPVVLDVREPHEFALASPSVDVPFELIQMPMRTVPQLVDSLDIERPIACLCHHGSRSMQVATFLANMGHDNVVNISGGMDAWAVQLDPSLARY